MWKQYVARIFLSIFGFIIMACAQVLISQLDIAATFQNPFQQRSLTEHEREIESNVIKPEHITERLSTIGGLSEIKEDVRAQILLPRQYAEVFHGLNKNSHPPRGILFHGKPGTGKTMLAKAIAAEANRPFVSLSLSSLENKWCGETNKLLEACFSYARKTQPCVLFFDEIDGMMRTRNQHDHSCVYAMKTEFLNHMDGMTTRNDDTFVVIACTNNIEILDPAVKRRLPQVYKVEAPNREELAEILKLYIGKSRIKTRDLTELISKLKIGCTGCDIAELVRTAWGERRKGVVNSEDFVDGLKKGTVNQNSLSSALGSLAINDLYSAAQKRELLVKLAHWCFHTH